MFFMFCKVQKLVGCVTLCGEMSGAWINVLNIRYSALIKKKKNEFKIIVSWWFFFYSRKKVAAFLQGVVGNMKYSAFMKRCDFMSDIEV